MAIVTINDEHLTNIATAIREKNAGKIINTGKEVALKTVVSKTPNAVDFETRSGNYSTYLDREDVVKIHKAKRLHVKVACQTEGSSFDWLTIKPDGGESIRLAGPELQLYEYDFPGIDTVTFDFHSNYTDGAYLGYYAEITGYGDEEVDAGTLTYKPKEMADAISAIGTAGGGSVTTLRTPDEIYEQDRPADWPVLPDPVVGAQETYFLCKTVTIGKVNAKTGTVGYIDENGEYVAVANTTGGYSGAYGYWTEKDISSSWDSRMDNYYVFKADSGYDYTAESHSSSSSPAVCTTNVLEIKTSHPNPMFGGKTKDSDSKYDTYRSKFPNVAFISFYGPQDWTRADYKFQYFYSLRCLRFDSNENNAFFRENTTITTATYMFDNCLAYQAEVRITPNWLALTTISYMCSGCRSLSKLTLDSPTVTSASTVISGSGDYLEEFYVNLPGITSSSTYLTGSNAGVGKITRFNMSGITASSQSLTSYAVSRAREVYNVLINKGSQSSWTLAPTSFAKRYTFAPEQTAANLPTKLTMNYFNPSKEGLIEFLNSLPDATGLGKTLAFGSYSIIGQADPSYPIDEDALNIAIAKGYTVTY